MTTDYAVNDFVRYATNGVCQIADIARMESPSSRKMADYYVLKPVNSPKTTLFVPLDNDTLVSRLSPVPERAELDGLIDASGREVIDWPEDRKARSEYFREIIKGCDQKELLRLVSCIYLKRRQLLVDGKKLSTSDDNILRQAERLIQGEFSFVLDIHAEQVGDYIRRRLGIAEEA